ncbi:hypothetical protein LINGRAHAP2_LOCUS25470 [Linum grandiflorum]
MSSAQCCRPVAYDQQNCNTATHHTQHHQGQVHSHNGSSCTKTQHHHNSNTAHNIFGGTKPTPNGANGGVTCQGAKSHRSSRRRNSEHKKRGLLQKIKDGISGHSDDDSCSSSSSSSSDSESDDDRKKNTNKYRGRSTTTSKAPCCPTPRKDC